MLTLDKKDFTIAGNDDEPRVDELCRALLKEFHRNLLKSGMQPLEAGRLAHGADYFLRDFIVSAQQRNLFDEHKGIVRRFAATWYIVTTMEPRIEELVSCLEGVREFYRFLHAGGHISAEHLRRIERECVDTAYYGKRIESFWDIRDDGYLEWERECPLKDGMKTSGDQ